MAYLGKNRSGNLVFQEGEVNLVLGIPATGTFDYIVARSGANLPAFDVLNVNPGGGSRLATVSGGTWNADVISTQYGGTGKSSYNNGDILIGSGSSLAALPSGAEGSYLKIVAGLQAWGQITTLQGSTVDPTPPVASGELLMWDGSQWTARSPQITNWAPFAPTGSWATSTTYDGQQRRIGDTIEVRMGLTLSGPPDAVILDIDIPLGLTVDVGKFDFPLSALDSRPIGTALLFDSGTAILNAHTVYNQVENKVRILVGDPTVEVSGSAPFPWDSGDSLHVQFSLPISGWSI